MKTPAQIIAESRNRISEAGKLSVKNPSAEDATLLDDLLDDVYAHYWYQCNVESQDDLDELEEEGDDPVLNRRDNVPFSQKTFAQKLDDLLFVCSWLQDNDDEVHNTSRTATGVKTKAAELAARYDVKVPNSNV